MQKSHRVLAIASLVLAPLLLAAIELFHPAHFTLNPGMTAFLSQPQPGDPYFNAITYFGPEWWFLLHMIQTPLVVVVTTDLSDHKTDQLQRKLKRVMVQTIKTFTIDFMKVMRRV